MDMGEKAKFWMVMVSAAVAPADGVAVVADPLAGAVVLAGAEVPPDEQAASVRAAPTRTATVR
jgi:hypothetical protein